MFEVLTDKETEERFGLTAEQLDEWEDEASKGILHGKPIGEVIHRGQPLGRPPFFGETMVNVAFKETQEKVTAIDERAQSLGLSRSAYLRQLVDQDLALAGTDATASAGA